MSRIEFDTGDRAKHQKSLIRWVRRRLADEKGKTISDSQTGDEWQQHGVLIADGVGMGKTWEALGAAAVLLYKRSRKRKDGIKRETNKRQLGRVLIIVPPNLVEKWSGEINRRGEKHFYNYLERWYSVQPERRRFIFETLSSAQTIRRESDIPRVSVIKGRLDPGGGVFIVSNRLIAKPKANKRLTALRRSPWDLVIVDEAHHGITNRILKNFLPAIDKGAPVLLLSATPFQLSLNELRPIFDHIGKKNNKGLRLINAKPIKAYLDVAKTLTADSDAVSTNRRTVSSANRFLRQIIARNSNIRGMTHRNRYFIKADGTFSQATLSADINDLARNLSEGAITPSPEFEAWYLRNRIRLGGTTLGGNKTCVATDLRQLLSTPGQAKRVSGMDLPPESMRLKALVAWFRKVAVDDLISTIDDGLPRKTIVFTSFVNPAAKELQDILQKVWTEAIAIVTRKTRDWHKRCGMALNRLQEMFEELKPQYPLRNDESQHAISHLQEDLDNNIPRALLLALSSPKYEKLIKKELNAAAKLASQDSDKILTKWGVKPDDRVGEIVEHAKRNACIHRRDYKWLLSALVLPPEVDRFDGESSMGQRSKISFAFQSMAGPWVLVASRVGFEGIDLHAWARRIVHFDLEWNPAVMEQREGRCDRIGRRLKKDPLDIFYLIVRGTYDERMFHQLSVRQQWHRMILGINRNNLDIEGDLPEPMTKQLDRLKALELNLSPEQRGG
ncbi:MAG: DEAD/DEAH box helicase [Desulfobacteraceae bacterium]|nr:DEAD/DEAH box helicase [Desulfobacteraceae bacterium]